MVRIMTIIGFISARYKSTRLESKPLAESMPSNVFVSIQGDEPLIDPRMIDAPVYAPRS
jgi:CMP-2-keto-3-deoxyoctulosonic acid synthetase